MLSKSTKVNSCPSITSSLRLRLHKDTVKNIFVVYDCIVNKLHISARSIGSSSQTGTNPV